MDRYELQDRYLELTRRALPAAAVRYDWPVREDHCFMRIVLDHLFGGCWYDHLDRRLRAYKQLNEGQLRRAIQIAEHMLGADRERVVAMNRASLRWRAARW